MSDCELRLFAIILLTLSLAGRSASSWSAASGRKGSASQQLKH